VIDPRRAGVLAGWLAWWLCGCTVLRPLNDLEAAEEAQPSQGHAASGVDAGFSPTIASPATVSCPDDMIPLRFADGLGFCVDRDEVSQAHYQSFLQSVGQALSEGAGLDGGDAGGRLREAGGAQGDAGMAANDSDASNMRGVDAGTDAPSSDLCSDNVLEPSNTGDCAGVYRPNERPAEPLSCVDVCDAIAYCAWAGKRLCGGRRGKLIVKTAKTDDLDRNEWYLACAGMEEWPYPYGPEYRRGACNVGTSSPEPVGSFEECRTPDGVADLSGNLAEWTFQSGESDGKRVFVVRGGSFVHEPEAGMCSFQLSKYTQRERYLPYSDARSWVGFRCCSD
jgi:formylglycine-generating enzyme required for sulfatase activity